MEANPRLFVVLVAFALMTGCGKSDGTFAVRGKATLADGTPLSGGSVTFLSTDGRSAVSRINEQGNYEMHQNIGDRGLPPGEYRITVTEPFSGDIDATPPARIHPKYLTVSTSGLTFIVEPKENQFDILLDPP